MMSLLLLRTPVNSITCANETTNGTGAETAPRHDIKLHAPKPLNP